MADIFPANPKFLVTTAQDGQIASYGNVSDENPNGAWTFQFVPTDINWSGQFAIVARTPGISTSDTTVPWVPVPYRRVCLNNVASDYALVSGILVVSGPTIIQVPANGVSIGLLMSITTSTCTIYAKAMNGATTP